MTVRRMVVTLVVESDACVRDLKERGFWDHARSEHFRVLDAEAHELKKVRLPDLVHVPVPA